jgi:TolA-binding protein
MYMATHTFTFEQQPRRREATKKTRKSSSCLRVFVVCSFCWCALATPASAANKEHQQLAADIRMLQEQAQLLQNMLGTLNETLKAVNTRLDDQSNAMRKAFADQKLLIDNLSSDLRVVREKVDDNNVRIASLTQELDALRQAVQQMGTRPPTTDAAGAPLPNPAGAPPPDVPAAANPPPPVGVSPKQLYDTAWADYTGGQWDLAIQGFEAYLRSFPKSEQACDAQVNIGKAYDYAGNKQKALEAFDKAIRDYPNGKGLPDAYYQKGLILLDLKQPDKAREVFESAAKIDPEGSAGRMAKQKLDQLKKP